MPASHELSGRDGWPPDLFLQDVAREMNLSETAFVREKLDRRRTVGRGDNEELFADYDLRWFTPSGAEVDLFVPDQTGEGIFVDVSTVERDFVGEVKVGVHGRIRQVFLTQNIAQ